MDLLEENLSYYDIEKEIRYSVIKVKMLDFCSVALYLSENKVQNKRRKVKLWKEKFRRHQEYCLENKITDAIPITILRKDFLFLFEDIKDRNIVYEWDKVIDMSFRNQIKIIGPRDKKETEVAFLKLGENLYSKFLISKFDLERSLIELTYFKKSMPLRDNKIKILNEILGVHNFEIVNNSECTEVCGKDIIYLLEKNEDSSHISLFEEGSIEPLSYCYAENRPIINTSSAKEVQRIKDKYFYE